MSVCHNELDPCAAHWLRCRSCETTKSKSDFSANGYGGLRSMCKVCCAKAAAARYAADPEKHRMAVKLSRERNLARALVDGARKRATKKGMPFDLSNHLDSIRDRLAIGLCELTGIPFEIGKGHHWASPSIDRIDSTRGYEYDNVRIILHGLNNALGNWGEQVLLQMVDALRSKK